MFFNVLKHLLILALITKGINNSNRLQGAPYPYILNEVSDFNDIVEQEYQSGANLQLKEEDEIPKRVSIGDYKRQPLLRKQQDSYESFGDTPPHDYIFSSSVLSDSGNNKDNLCPKHDIKHRDSVAVPQRVHKLLPQKEVVEESNLERPQMVRLVPQQGEHNDFETAQTVVIKENNLPHYATVSELVPEIEVNSDETNTDIPDYVYDFDNAKNDESCENCNSIKNLFPIPMLESILINKLLESNDKSKPYPIKYIVKNVIPNFKNIDELDKPKTQQCLRTYLHRRKRQLEFLKKRGTRRKKSHKKKKKPKKKKKKHRKHRSVNDNFDNKLNGMAAYVSKNQTFNETLTYMPLIFGTVTPAEGQMLLAGIKHDASAEEKLMLEKILSIKPEDLASSSNNANILQSTLGKQSTTTQPGAQPSQDNPKYNLNLNLNSPEVKKTFMEIMQRQQNYDTYEATSNKVKRDAGTSPASTSVTSAASSSSTESGALGLVVTNPTSLNDASVVPGILIYPRGKQRKRFASGIPEVDGGSMLNQADINTILKTIDTAPNEKNDAYLEAPKSKKQCKTDKCTDETDKIMDALNNLNHQSLKSEELGADNYASTTFPPLTSAAQTSQKPGASTNLEQRKADKPNLAMEEKLAKLRKDLNMVKEIQHIFDSVAKKEHQRRKRNTLNKNVNKKMKHFDTEPEENKYDAVVGGLIQARMWLKNNRSGCAEKANRQYLEKKRTRRFLAIR